MQTLQLGLNLFKGLNVTQWGYLCAGMTIAIFPLILVFLIMQRQFIGGLTAGAVRDNNSEENPKKGMGPL